MKQIDLSYITKLNPCTDRFDNYKNHYSEWSGNLSEFLDLTDITHKDKLWVFFRSIERKTIQLVASDFAESVLHFFESKYPNDKRPRLAIEAARSGINPRASAYAAYAARASAAYGASAAAAYAAEAAASAAYTASAAAYAYAARDSDDYAASAAAYAASYAASAAAYAAGRKNEEQKQICIMKRYC